LSVSGPSASSVRLADRERRKVVDYGHCSGGRHLLTKQADLTAVSNDVTSIKRSQPEDRITVWIGDVALGLNQYRRHVRSISLMPNRILRHLDVERAAWLGIVNLLAENRDPPVDVNNIRRTPSDKAGGWKCRPCHSVSIALTVNVRKWATADRLLARQTTQIRTFRTSKRLA
jgi:hypothetical protein